MASLDSKVNRLAVGIVGAAGLLAEAEFKEASAQQQRGSVQVAAADARPADLSSSRVAKPVVIPSVEITGNGIRSVADAYKAALEKGVDASKFPKLAEAVSHGDRIVLQFNGTKVLPTLESKDGPTIKPKSPRSMEVTKVPGKVPGTFHYFVPPSATNGIMASLEAAFGKPDRQGSAQQSVAARPQAAAPSNTDNSNKGNIVFAKAGREKTYEIDSVAKVTNNTVIQDLKDRPEIRAAAEYLKSVNATRAMEGKPPVRVEIGMYALVKDGKAGPVSTTVKVGKGFTSQSFDSSELVKFLEEEINLDNYRK